MFIARAPSLTLRCGRSDLWLRSEQDDRQCGNADVHDQSFSGQRESLAETPLVKLDRAAIHSWWNPRLCPEYCQDQRHQCGIRNRQYRLPCFKLSPDLGVGRLLPRGKQLISSRNPNHILLDYFDATGSIPFAYAAMLNGVTAPTQVVSSLNFASVTSTTSGSSASVSASSLKSGSERVTQWAFRWSAVGMSLAGLALGFFRTI